MKQYFRSGPPQRKLNIDEESRSILNVVAIQKGDLKDSRPWAIDEEFMSDLVGLANKQTDGVMVNYDHNYNNLGRRLGRSKNWRIEKSQVKCDIELFEAANKSPEGPLLDYVMAMATEDDKALMMSINFDINYFYQRDSAGKQIKVWYYDEEYNWVRENPKMGKVYPKILALHSLDVVGEGAATDALFSMDEKLVVLSRLMADDDMPSILEQHADQFPALSKFIDKRGNQKSFFEKIKSLLSSGAESDKPIHSQVNSESMSQITQEAFDALQQERDQLKADNEALTTEIAQLKQTNTEQESKVDALSSKVETLLSKVEEIKSMSSAFHSSGNEEEEEEEDTKKVPLYMQNPIYKKRQEITAGLSKNKK